MNDTDELKISEMEEAEEVNNEDLIMIVQDGRNKKTKAKNVGVGGEATGDTLPIGATIEWHSDIIPENWLLCNGQAISRIDYPELFNVLGTKYGTGDGSTTFNLPDLQGKVVVGKDENDTDFDVLGKTGGEKEHTLTVAEMPEHSHVLTLKYGSGNAKWGLDGDWSAGTENTEQIKNTGGNQAHNNLQPFLTCNFVIKAKQSSGLVATVVDNLNSTSETDALSARQGKKILELVLPIGSTYITQTNVNPNSILGFGTWERLKGKVCLGVDEEDVDLNEIGKTGGEKEHALTIEEMPSHSHHTSAELYALKPQGGTQEFGAGGATSKMIAINNTGGNQAHNNMQPFEVVGYMWIRRA